MSTCPNIDSISNCLDRNDVDGAIAVSAINPEYRLTDLSICDEWIKKAMYNPLHRRFIEAVMMQPGRHEDDKTSLFDIALRTNDRVIVEWFMTMSGRHIGIHDVPNSPDYKDSEGSHGGHRLEGRLIAELAFENADVDSSTLLKHCIWYLSVKQLNSPRLLPFMTPTLASDAIENIVNACQRYDPTCYYYHPPPYS